MEKNVDGIIMNSITALDRAEQKRLAESGVPVVLLNSHEKNSPFSTVWPTTSTAAGWPRNTFGDSAIVGLHTCPVPGAMEIYQCAPRGSCSMSESQAVRPRYPFFTEDIPSKAGIRLRGSFLQSEAASPPSSPQTMPWLWCSESRNGVGGPDSRRRITGWIR